MGKAFPPDDEEHGRYTFAFLRRHTPQQLAALSWEFDSVEKLLAQAMRNPYEDRY
jgi:hypothetical protein